MTWSMPFIVTLQQANITSIAGWLLVMIFQQPPEQLNGLRSVTSGMRINHQPQWMDADVEYSTPFEICPDTPNGYKQKSCRSTKASSNYLGDYKCEHQTSPVTSVVSWLLHIIWHTHAQFFVEFTWTPNDGTHIPVSFPYCASSGQSRWGLHRDGLASFTHSLID